jgi:hypothetical protein
VRLLRAGLDWLLRAAATVGGVLLVLIGVVAAFCVIPLLPMTLISAGMRLMLRGGRFPTDA